jgi:hypothetical protein
VFNLSWLSPVLWCAVRADYSVGRMEGRRVVLRCELHRMVLSFIVGFWVILMVILLWMCSSIISSEQSSSEQLLLPARGPESELGIVSSFWEFSITWLVSFPIESACSDLVKRVKQGLISGKGLWLGSETRGIWCSRRRDF